MAELKTKANDGDVDAFLAAVLDEGQRADAAKLLSIFKEITGEQPKMWGTAMVGFGQYHYKSERSSQEGDWLLTGFSPRKVATTLYLTTGFEMKGELLEKLGKHRLGKGCLYIKHLSDVDEKDLRDLIKTSFEEMKRVTAAK